MISGRFDRVRKRHTTIALLTLGCVSAAHPETQPARVALPPVPPAPSSTEPQPSEPTENVGDEHSADDDGSSADDGGNPAPTAEKPVGACPSLDATPRPDYRMTASHILLAYVGALRAKPEVTRAKDEARSKAEELFLALQRGADFEALAQAESDCPTRSRGGHLGTFEYRMMVRPFSEAVAALEPDQFCVVETPFGFHVVMRE